MVSSVGQCLQDLCQASSQLEEPPVKTTKSKRTRKKLDETESNEARVLLAVILFT